MGRTGIFSCTGLYFEKIQRLFLLKIPGRQNEPMEASEKHEGCDLIPEKKRVDITR